ncbi:Uncharacterized protein OS=Pirellula staleyi (strain ATCC 27377 / DSM 6068 / ICPB 4128) GN=Psta_0325 PE=4 SV=1: PSCyt2: PSD1 [Gemmata massiliana]|uniref:DUF1553 domain-containing protein n=1 Tax=Gemmata massiliana TaxID=1210884 RepID=A0A6P2CW41_9BACT|nr:DUF1549 and DUF1553 domain-containing protein [Gemmata massiliana]VTR92385.1 Uncharacterized protein OS=Pirellula staleyi (strain ATCC 27377 / DSM 6068 / ICPB 4128) GN=Psta_0325 PE=4 SV=1: PSCyt2: PSD1 [Gemmata massiliana]
MRVAVLVICVLIDGGTASAAPPDPGALAVRIDKHLQARWDAEKVKPADRADDATFVRRVHLDLVGRIPTVAEVRAFLDDKDVDKRAKLVAQLVDSAAHARHAATFWRRQWVPQADAPQFANLADDLESWIASSLRTGAAYDRVVRDLLTASRVKTGPGAPTTFLTASEAKPENLAANTARAFLGINLDCAQCHDHPFARWTRDQFWQTAAFFVRPTVPDGTTPARLELVVPSTKKPIGPRLLNDSEPKWPAVLKDDTGRVVLAEWVTARDNPYFARNAVNRVWAELFGTGIVEPLDDLSGSNPPVHPELLDDLAQAFTESNFDLKYLTTALVLTRAYQLSAVVPAGGSSDPRWFACSAVRGLTGEQLYDSLRVAAGLPADREDLDPTIAPRERKRFAEKFRVERTGSAQRSILQSLSLMNGKLTTDLTDVAKAPALRAVAGAPFLDTKGKVEALYLAVLGRKPADDESAPFVKYVENGGADRDANKALADVLWALLNSTEFNTNH